MAYPYDYAVDFTPTAADGTGPYADVPGFDMSGLGAFTISVTFELDTLDGTNGQLIWGQWGNGNILLLTTVNNGELGSSVDGVRVYGQCGGNIRVWDYLIVLSTNRHTFVTRYDGTQGGDANWDVWYALQGDSALTDITSSLTHSDPFGASAGWQATLPTDTGNFRWGGDSFSSAHTIDGRVVDLVYWSSALSDANATGTSMWNGTAGEPADHSSLSPVGWWAGGDDDITGSTITDVGSGGNDTALTANSGTTPSIVLVGSAGGTAVPVFTSQYHRRRACL